MKYQFLPRLSDEEYRALEESIREHGVQVPILVDENKAVVDGYHRKEIADRLGVECPRRFVLDKTDEEKRTLALSLNLDRRHLTREQKRELVAKSLQADPQLSDRQHARRTGVSHPTVAQARTTMQESGQLESFTSRTSADGRTRPATQPPHTPNVDRETGEILDDPEPEVVDAELVEDEPAADPTPPPAPRITGRDGKSYPRPEPATAPKRRPLPDAFLSATYELTKKVTTLTNLAADDRLAANKEKVATANRSDLIRARDALDRLIEQLS